MSKQCEIVQDLLPLYVDGACSEASAEMIKEHLESCADCRAIYVQMCSHTNEDILQKEKDGVVKRHERKESQKVIKYIFFALGIIYVPALFFVALFAGGDAGFIATPYIFDLMVLFLYTFPCYLALIELGLSVCRAFEKRDRSIGEKIFNTIGAIFACGILITLTNLEDLLFVSLALAGALALNWLISAIVYKKKPNLKATFKDKTFWICAGILLVVATLLASIPMVLLAPRYVQEETLEVGYSIGYRDSGTEYDGLYFDIGMEEQHSWDVIGKNPTFTVKWVNETGTSIEYDMKCYIYKQTSDGWGLCSTDYIDFSDEIHTLENGEIKSQVYSIEGYDLKQSGRYKFVTFVDSKAIWVEFEVTLNSAKREDIPSYYTDKKVLVIEGLDALDEYRDSIVSRYTDGDIIVVLNIVAAYEVQGMLRESVAATFGQDMQAVIFYQANGVPGTYEITGNTSDLDNEIEEAVVIIKTYQAAE